MTKEQLELFKQFALEYSQRFKLCFCATTGSKYPKTFSKHHYIRFLDYLSDKHKIEVDENDMKSYKIYEKIMVGEINKFIEDYIKIANEKERSDAKNKNVKRKKD